MAIASLILGLLSIALAMIGAVSAAVPEAGPFISMFSSFAGVLCALVGIVLGGISISRARDEGTGSGLAIAGTTISGVAILPALFVALSCGLCSSFRAAEQIEGDRVDAGMLGDPIVQFPAEPPAIDAGPPLPNAPPPAFPPPPMSP